MTQYTLNYTEKTPITQPIEAEKINAFINKKMGDFSNGFMFCWLHQKVLIGEIKEGKVHFKHEEITDYSRDVVRIRLFNVEKEWHIWRSHAGFTSRFREDADKQNPDKNDTPFVEAELVLWGTQSKKIGSGFQQVSEERGTGLILPESLGFVKEGKQNQRFVVNTRNYIDFNDTGQAGYVDSRFTNIYLKAFQL